jgi:hypothetical protein
MEEVICSVLEFREEKWTFAKVEEGKIDFFSLCYSKLENPRRTPGGR